MRVLVPDYMPPLPNDAGEVLLAARLYHEALPFLEARHARQPDARSKVTLGLCLFYHDRHIESEAMLRAATVEAPDKAMTWHSLGNLLEGLGQFREALGCYDVAVGIRPDVPAINYGVASNLLRMGRFDEAWPYWERGRTLLSVDRVPIWEGEPLAGKRILVIREGGYGDVLWLARYLPMLKQMGAHVTLYSYSGLKGLLAKHPWIDAYVDAGDVDDKGLPGLETDVFDYQVSLMSIMAVLKKCPEPMEKPYFRSPHPVARNGHKRIGICWKAGEHGGVVRKIRSIPVVELEPLREIDAQWISLQLGEPAPEWVEDYQEAITGWTKTCDMIASLDLVVSADTAIAHLAGAMGKPTLTLLPLNWEFKWAWTQDWYPAMRDIKSTNPVSFSPAIEKAIPMIREMI